MVTWSDGDNTPTESYPAVFRLVDATEDSCRVHIRVCGELDMLTTPQLADLLRSRLDSSPGEVVVDLRMLSFLSATGVGTLISAACRTQEWGGRFAVIGCRPAVLRIIDVVGAGACLHATAQEAPPREARGSAPAPSPQVPQR